MYARYIPPPKGGSKPAPAPHPVEAPPSNAPSASPVVSSATPYSRYVPPARPSQNSVATPTPAPRAPPTSKTHLNAAAIPRPEELPAKIVFNYDDDEPAPSPSKKRKIEAAETEPEQSPVKEFESTETPKKSKKGKKDKKDKIDRENSVEEKKKKKEKRSKDKEEDPIEESQKDEKKKKKKRKEKEKDQRQPFTFGFDESVTAPEVEEANPQALQVDDPKTKAEKQGGDRESKSTKQKRSEEKDAAERHKSVLEKAAKSIKEGSQKKAEESAEDEDEIAPVEAHGLEPLPQPEPVSLDGSVPTYETLPPWIANPIRVTPETKASFEDLGINKEVATKLGSKAGYENAFAVQTAVIPLLLPSPDRQGDVVVSAATGSGKTLAYVLPMVTDVSLGSITRLRGLIVVPTRELVLQAKEVCEACVACLSGPARKPIQVGISMGNKQFEQEQADLIMQEQRFDPEGHETWLREHFEQDLETSLFDESSRPLPGHIVDYKSKVDILICTPGRLVDHVNRTKGFTLDYVRWLVVDEADKLLAQTFQDWLPVVMPKLSTTTKTGARDFPESNKSGVRKVILSATMTRDISLLNNLKLVRPKLVTLDGMTEDGGPAREGKAEHVLPDLLDESAIKIRDPNLKPLYLVGLLNGPHMKLMNGADEDIEMKDVPDEHTSSSSSESDSESSDSDPNSSEDFDSELDSDASTTKRKPSSSLAKQASFHTTVLIFTKSNETAIRLSRLLSLLSPKLSPLIGTLTSTTRTSQRRKTLRAFTTGKLRVLVASDLVARGIDLSNLDHVVNYDMPTSVASYVHRVGRTARAGRKGHAWTLFTKTEAGWFWTAIAGKGESKSAGAAGAGHIKRRGKVEEVRLNDRWEEDKVSEFESALEELGREASEMRRRM